MPGQLMAAASPARKCLYSSISRQSLFVSAAIPVESPQKRFRIGQQSGIIEPAAISFFFQADGVPVLEINNTV
ncbi:hypothetical protein [Bacteroides gallinarum]|uniref:hypothetical protein n=1 Tax=Bacteroides gallinarum TaxID=376806 RepID=UPI001427BFE0|nr:hypothetical protein [Bacteroides gallinarum]